jgi:hypothetical protein
MSGDKMSGDDCVISQMINAPPNDYGNVFPVANYSKKEEIAYIANMSRNATTKRFSLTTHNNGQAPRYRQHQIVLEIQCPHCI